MEGDQVTIVDFAVTWDANEGILIQICAAKRAKYACLKRMYPGKTVSVFGMAFGARSMLCRETLKAGECLGLTKRDVGWLSVGTLLGSIIVLSRFGSVPPPPLELSAANVRLDLSECPSFPMKQWTQRLLHRGHAPRNILFCLLAETCEAVQEPRCSRHNFISKAIDNKLQSRHKDAVISTDRLLVAAEGTRLGPDIVVDLKDRTFVFDVVVAWDARADTLEAMCTHKIEKYLPLVPILQKRHPSAL
ncbi:hypothetical protein HPB50_010442 [Hyalomma asiaticum]|uniref:Uncharacterized protein n=1 Tax=Hyalomma asiaticum TaxID=266040 RepID=A0ACB7T149_HYAAI|nr:hypothetical protein HPB50_010442 [Hyalomma asiaticum]